MYAFTPSRRAPSAPRRRVERKLLGESLAVIAGMVAGGFLGSTLAELYVWLTDQETYWSAKLDEALVAADEAKQKLAAIDQARAQAEAEAAQAPADAGGWW